MKCFRTLFLAVLATAFSTMASAPAQEPIRMARTPDISPDGKTVAFSYLGDIWIVEAIGGIARPVTMHEAITSTPSSAPTANGSPSPPTATAATTFSSCPSHGGKPRRLTFDSAADMVNGWSPDGKYILFSSTRNVSFPLSYELYTVPFEAAGSGGSAPARAARAASRPRETRSPTSAAPAPGIARAIAARPTTTFGFATPTAATTAA